MPKHANLSASGAELWSNCPGSVHMATLYPGSSSPAAAEGTLAHALAETMILDRLQGVKPEEFEAHDAKITDFYSRHADMGGSFEGMKKILEPYVDFIFEEFKGTGNMEIHLDRNLSERRIFPAIDINKSGTRREDLLMNQEELMAVWQIRKDISNSNSTEVTEKIIDGIERTKNNRELLMMTGKM